MSVSNKLAPASLEWALRHLALEGDGDVFPVPFEIRVIQDQWPSLKPKLENIDITNHLWQSPRSVLVPRDEMSFRRACQLDPIDALLFSATIYEIGKAIEQRRRPANEVFSYRFAPDVNGALFSKPNPWEQFWQEAKKRAEGHAYAFTLDITDYYNQIYHHTLENQLLTCAVPTPHRKAILGLLSRVSDGVSRGIPIGPHAAHLLAELNLVPLDDLLTLQKIPFIRYVDDIHVYCDTPRAGQQIIFTIAEYLDRSQKLTLNNQKTERRTRGQYRDHTAAMLLDNPINAAEQRILKVIRGRGGGYTRINITDLTADELTNCSGANIRAILEEYLRAADPNYTRLRWFLRRLSQLGVPGGVDFVLEHLEQLLPAIGDVASYLNAAIGSYTGDWPKAGKGILRALEDPIVEKNEYLQVVLLSLFARIKELNHLQDLVQSYDDCSPAARRKIMLVAAQAPAAASWLQVKRATFGTMDPWQRRAYLYATKQLPPDERRHWLSDVRATFSPLEEAIAASASAKQ